MTTKQITFGFIIGAIIIAAVVYGPEMFYRSNHEAAAGEEVIFEPMSSPIDSLKSIK